MTGVDPDDITADELEALLDEFEERDDDEDDEADEKRGTPGIVADEDAEPPAWVDSHSVTCAICGDFADERRTANLTRDEMELGEAMQEENPERYQAILDAVEEYGEGEAHEDCLQEEFMEGDD